MRVMESPMNTEGAFLLEMNARRCRRALQKLYDVFRK